MAITPATTTTAANDNPTAIFVPEAIPNSGSAITIGREV